MRFAKLEISALASPTATPPVTSLDLQTGGLEVMPDAPVRREMLNLAFIFYFEIWGCRIGSKVSTMYLTTKTYVSLGTLN